MPAGRPAKVDHVRNDFISSVDQSIALVRAIKALPTKVRTTNATGLHPTYVDQVVSLAFMGIVASWEEFLERTAVRYLTGAETGSGYQPKLKYGKADTIKHAYELLSLDSDYKPDKSYLKVTDTKWLRRVADFYFSSHPYSALQNNTDLLKNANKIRNRVAHDSTKCKADFKAAAIWFLQPANDTLTQGYGPGRLLQAPVQRHFGNAAVQKNLSHLEAYVEFYKRLAKKIVP